MASFTDIIPQFNPYVQQLPVEAMVKVGMAKQQAYEQNVTKIQAEIDRVAGLDIMRGVDKEYLQSKMNALGNRLTLLAGGDFSNFQLANSVTGMAGQISKDKFVQNAVSSTAWYRKQAAEMETAIKEGKASQSNIWDFNEKVNAYTSSTDLSRSFSDRYVQYTDVKKKAMDAIKALHPELQKYDIPFEVVNGQIVVDKRGKEAIADAMQRYKIEGIDEGQIKAAIAATLTPDDINQLSIDGRYQFRGVTPEQLVNRAAQSYKLNKDNAIASLKLLEEKRGVVTDPTQLANVEKKIEYYKKQIGENGKPGELDDQFAADLRNARENPDAVKTSIYKDGFVKEFANAFSWKNVEMEYVKNPIRDQMNWVEEMKFKQAQERRQWSEFGWKQKMDLATLDLRTKEVSLKAEENALKNAELYGIDAPWTTVGNETDNILRAEEMFTNHSDGVAQNYTAGENQLKASGYSQEQINSMVNNTNASVPANAIKTVQEMRKQKNYLQSLKTFEQNLRADSDREAGVAEKKKEVLAGKKPVTVNWKGQSFTLSPEEILGIKAATSTKETGSKGGTRREVTVNKSGLNRNQINFVNSMQGVLYGKFEPGPQPAGVDAFRGQLNSALGQYDKPVKDLNEAIKKSNEIYKGKLAPVISKFVPQIKALGSDKDGSPTAITLGKVSALITATIARGVAADDVWDASTASEMLQSKNSKDTRIFIQQDGENYQLVMKSESDSDKLQRIRLSKAEVRANFGDKYVNDLTQESIRLDLGRGNTNISRRADQSIMQKSFGDFPGIRKLDITADFTQDISDPNLFIPGINIKKKDGRYQYFELSGVDKLSRVGFEQGKRNLNNLTDDALLKYLRVEYPNYDYSQLELK
jgi:hypothetical protein